MGYIDIDIIVYNKLFKVLHWLDIFLEYVCSPIKLNLIKSIHIDATFSAVQKIT